MTQHKYSDMVKLRSIGYGCAGGYIYVNYASLEVICILLGIKMKPEQIPHKK